MKKIATVHSVKHQSGFSLVELMVAITVGLILMTGVVQMFLSSKTVFTTQQGISRVQETGRLAIEFLAKDIREAGYMGCMSRAGINFFNTLNDPTAFEVDFETGIQAFNGKPDDVTLNPEPIADTPSLVIRSANGSGVSVESDNNLNNLQTFNPLGKTGENCSSGICNEDILIVTDCAKARVFQTNNVQDNGDTMKINHSGAEMTPGNAYPTWGGNKSPNEKFGPGSEIIKIRTLVYYIAENPETKRPGLYLKEGFAPAFELLEGVENMSLQFGVDTNADARVDNTVDIAGVGNWESVIAVQLELLVQSPDDYVIPEEQTYDFAGKEGIKPGDKRIRQVFNTTVGIRTRLN